MTIFLKITKEGDEYLAESSGDDLSEDLQKEFNILLFLSTFDNQTDEMHLSKGLSYNLDEIQRHTKNLSRKGRIKRSSMPLKELDPLRKQILEPIKIKRSFPGGKSDEITEEGLSHERNALYRKLLESGRRFCNEYQPEWPVTQHNGMCKWYIRAKMRHCGVPFTSREVCLTGEDSGVLYGDKSIRFPEPKIEEHEYEVG